MTFALFGVSRLAPKLMPLLGAKPLMITGMVPAIASLAGVPAADSGAASGLVNMLQLAGGSLGLAVLVAVFGTASGHATSPDALTHGMGTAFGLAALLDVGSLLVIIALIRTRRLRPAPAPAPRQQEEVVAS